ncbi:MAG: lecithin retinol acyltransferase family protein [Dolichospermum sp. BR01]|nr:lecithin retinol acyltransferase family protein [Dolichospermum sp. BR01]
MAYGDHLVRKDGDVFIHHGIECDNEEVIHFGRENGKGIIRKTSLTEFSRGKSGEVNMDAVYIVDYCDYVTQNDRYDVVEIADFLYRHQAKYNPFTYNCETLALFCKTGNKEYIQVENDIALPVKGLISSQAKNWTTLPVRIVQFTFISSVSFFTGNTLGIPLLLYLIAKTASEINPHGYSYRKRKP